jgi:hypothetical protein
MSSPASEPAREPHVEQTSLPQVALFSHPPTVELLKPYHPLPGDRVDWRTARFSPAQRRSAASDEAKPGAPKPTRKPPAGTTT